MITEDITNETKEYQEFVEKFKPKKTTDDCYTPPNVYDAVKNWAINEYGLQGRQVLRPFYPGGDYENEQYPDGCVVIDNPPFSILSKICRFYDERKIDYFLFAPTLVLFGTNSGGSNYIVCSGSITYANGAVVDTSFITNLGDVKIHLSPDLYDAIKEANDQNTKAAVQLPKYEYPDCVVNAGTLGKIIKRRVELKIGAKDAIFIRAMDRQREAKKKIFGDGFLLSERAAAERAAAERAAAERAAAEHWELSDRELAMQAQMNTES